MHEISYTHNMVMLYVCHCCGEMQLKINLKHVINNASRGTKRV